MTPKTVAADPRRAVTVVNEALEAFEDATRLTPLVILVPPTLFNRLAAERAAIEAALPDKLRALPPPGDEWVDVRVVENPRGDAAGIEVY